MYLNLNVLCREEDKVRFEEFFIKKILLSFFVTVTCISVAMAVLGMLFFPNVRFGYEAFLFPLLFGAVTVLPGMLFYSKKEIPIKQVIVRKVLQLVYIETIIIGMNYLNGALINLSVTLLLALSIIIICLIVDLVLWANDKKTAKDFNKNLKKWQDEIGKDISTD